MHVCVLLGRLDTLRAAAFIMCHVVMMGDSQDDITVLFFVAEVHPPAAGAQPLGVTSLVLFLVTLLARAAYTRDVKGGGGGKREGKTERTSKGVGFFFRVSVKKARTTGARKRAERRVRVFFSPSPRGRRGAQGSIFTFPS